MKLRRTSKHILVLSLAVLLGCGGQGVVAPTQAAPAPNLTGVIQTLIDLLELQDKTPIAAEDYEATSLKEIREFRTPAGYRLYVRYLNFGVSLVEGLKAARDPELRRRMIEMVQWSRNPKVRAQAILTLASLLDPTHKKYFKEAILDSKIGIRFAAVEALQVWGQDEAISLLRLAADRDWSPLMKVYAAQALLSLGQEDAINVLWKHMDHDSWVVRAMASRYLGDYGKPDDYTRLVEYLNKETRNDFVIAEMSLSALKLISKKGEKISYSPATPGWRQNEEVAYTIGKDRVVELEPLVIVPPQLRIPPSLAAAARINTGLLRLIKERLSEPMSKIDNADPVYLELNTMVTPSGFALYTRYSQLSYLVIESLAGTNDLLLRSELKRLATDSTDPLVKATALLAIAYSRDDNDVYLVQEALTHRDSIVRMGALEAVEAGRFRSILPQVTFVAGNDASPAIQLYALQVMAKFDNPSARFNLISRLNDPDWPARAMAFWYIGRYGTAQDYNMVLARLAVEQNPFVKSEITLAALRLAPLQQ